MSQSRSVGQVEHPLSHRPGAVATSWAWQRVSALLVPAGIVLDRGHPWDPQIRRPRALRRVLTSGTLGAGEAFILEDRHNFGPDYDRTLMAWHANLEAAWPTLSLRYSDRFRRWWRYYLLTCAGTFRPRRNQLWQFVLLPRGVRGGYRRVA